MIEWVISFLFEATANWGREILSKRLRGGGAFAQSLSDFIEMELCTIRRQLDALVKKDLDESIDLFLEGLTLVGLADAGPPSQKIMGAKDLLDEVDAEKICNSFSDEAKERFKDARKKAGSAIAMLLKHCR